MAMRQDDSRQIVTIFFEKIEVGDRNINAVRGLLRETHARINDDHLIAVPDAHAVHPKLADPAERYNFYLVHWVMVTRQRATRRVVSFSTGVGIFGILRKPRQIENMLRTLASLSGLA
jgi:hypothetical protein